MICMRRRIIGLLQSQDLDGKPTFGFIVTGWPVNEFFVLRLREDASCWLLSKTSEYFEDQRGLLRRKTGIPLDRVVFCLCVLK